MAKASKPKTGAWEDPGGELLTWDQLVEEVMVNRLINRNFSRLMYQLKVPVLTVASAAHEARKEYYGWKRPVVVKATEAPQPAKKPVTKKAEPVPAKKPAKKTIKK
jgi:hypothetical protein